MPLGLIPEAYAVYRCETSFGGAGEIVTMHGERLFFASFNDAKIAAEEFLSYFTDPAFPPPKYVWIAPIQRLWIDGEL